MFRSFFRFLEKEETCNEFQKEKISNTLPGEYFRKKETQKNWLLERPMVEPWGLIENVRQEAGV